VHIEGVAPSADAVLLVAWTSPRGIPRWTGIQKKMPAAFDQGVLADVRPALARRTGLEPGKSAHWALEDADLGERSTGDGRHRGVAGVLKRQEDSAPHQAPSPFRQRRRSFGNIAEIVPRRRV
jgi:hypothetical protein